jgi:hypothetical protein
MTMRVVGLLVGSLAVGCFLPIGSALAQATAGPGTSTAKLPVVVRGANAGADVISSPGPIAIQINPDAACRLHYGYPQTRLHIHCDDGMILRLKFTRPDE